jgi:hypothetical protein
VIAVLEAARKYTQPRDERRPARHRRAKLRISEFMRRISLHSGYNAISGLPRPSFGFGYLDYPIFCLPSFPAPTASSIFKDRRDTSSEALAALSSHSLRTPPKLPTSSSANLDVHARSPATAGDRSRGSLTPTSTAGVPPIQLSLPSHRRHRAAAIAMTGCAESQGYSRTFFSFFGRMSVLKFFH